jgi:hypothetical protein
MMYTSINTHIFINTFSYIINFILKLHFRPVKFCPVKFCPVKFCPGPILDNDGYLKDYCWVHYRQFTVNTVNLIKPTSSLYLNHTKYLWLLLLNIYKWYVYLAEICKLLSDSNVIKILFLRPRVIGMLKRNLKTSSTSSAIERQKSVLILF